MLAEENVVALCDVNEKRFPDALKRFPKAKTYVDWRKCLDQKDIDAVVCCTADHTHAFIANWALNRDLHVYMEKPLAISVEEARIVRANWLKKKDKLATQVGMQRHAMQNFNRVRELIRDGAIGELTAAYAWGDRQIRRAGYLPARRPAARRFPLRSLARPVAGASLQPRLFLRRGGHELPVVEHVLGLRRRPDRRHGQPHDGPAVERRRRHVADLGGSQGREVQSRRHAGGMRVALRAPGQRLARTDPHQLVPGRGHAAVAEALRRSEEDRPRRDVQRLEGLCHRRLRFAAAAAVRRQRRPDLLQAAHGRDKVLPPLGHFQKQWIDACKDTSLKTACDFEYSGNMIEQLLLGLVAYRVGKKLDYDGAAGRVTNSPEANELLRRQYRPGWTLDG